MTVKALAPLQEVSYAQGGRGLSLRQNTPVQNGQVGVPIILGQSPDKGTACTLFLATNFDAAYDGATVDFMVMILGRTAIFQSVVIDAAIVAAQPAIELSVSGCAADFWQVQITFPAAVPAAQLQSAIIATGVENLTGENTSPAGALTFVATATGPGATGVATFHLPAGTSVWQVTGVARVLAPGGGSESAGDSYSVTVPVTWNLTAGVARLVPVTLAAPDVSTDADMASTTFASGVSGANATITYTTDPGLDAGTTVLISITLIPLDLG